MLITVLSVARGVRPPDLLRNGLRQQTRLPLALLDFEIRAHKLRGPLLHLQIELISSIAHRAFCTFASRTYHGDGYGAKNEGGEEALRLLCDADGEEGRNKEIANDNGRKDDRQESGGRAAEPGAAHDGAEKKKDKRVGDHMLQREGPNKRHQDKTNRDGTRLSGVFHHPA